MLKPHDATDIFLNYGIPRGSDFHRLDSDQVAKLLEAADRHKYRKPKNANGSRARYFHAFLERLAMRADRLQDQKAMNRNVRVNGQVHRFGDLVAVHIGTGQTCYLQPKEAREFAKALSVVARSCETESFLKSTCGTKSFRFGEES